MGKRLEPDSGLEAAYSNVVIEDLKVVNKGLTSNTPRRPEVINDALLQWLYL